MEMGLGQAIAFLPRTEKELVALLRSEGIKGMRGNSCGCPVARLLTKLTGLSEDEIMVGLTSVVRRFYTASSTAAVVGHKVHRIIRPARPLPGTRGDRG